MKKMMSSVLAILVIAMFVLTACGPKPTAAPTAAPATAKPATAAPATVAPATEAPATEAAATEAQHYAEDIKKRSQDLYTEQKAKIQRKPKDVPVELPGEASGETPA